jgi:hypothetical protein
MEPQIVRPKPCGGYEAVPILDGLAGVLATTCAVKADEVLVVATLHRLPRGAGGDSVQVEYLNANGELTAMSFPNAPAAFVVSTRLRIACEISIEADSGRGQMYLRIPDGIVTMLVIAKRSNGEDRFRLIPDLSAVKVEAPD